MSFLPHFQITHFYISTQKFTKQSSSSLAEIVNFPQCPFLLANSKQCLGHNGIYNLFLELSYILKIPGYQLFASLFLKKKCERFLEGQFWLKSTMIPQVLKQLNLVKDKSNSTYLKKTEFNKLKNFMLCEIMYKNKLSHYFHPTYNFKMVRYNYQYILILKKYKA